MIDRFELAAIVIKQMERVERNELSLLHAAAELGMIPSEFTAVYALARKLLSQWPSF